MAEQKPNNVCEDTLFSELFKAHSKDPGSAPQGGDLDLSNN